jgi:hypothetical protein
LLNRYRVKSSIEGSNPSLSATESISFRICYLIGQTSPHLAGNHDSSSNQRITFPAAVPHLFPNSLNATVAVPFLNGNGPQVRCLTWIGEVELQTRSLKMDVRFEIPLGLARWTRMLALCVLPRWRLLYAHAPPLALPVDAFARPLAEPIRRRWGPPYEFRVIAGNRSRSGVLRGKSSRPSQRSRSRSSR